MPLNEFARPLPCVLLPSQAATSIRVGWTCLVRSFARPNRVCYPSRQVLQPFHRCTSLYVTKSLQPPAKVRPINDAPSKRLGITIFSKLLHVTLCIRARLAQGRSSDPRDTTQSGCAIFLLHRSAYLDSNATAKTSIVCRRTRALPRSLASAISPIFAHRLLHALSLNLDTCLSVGVFTMQA
jgi:hypothetical protein